MCRNAISRKTSASLTAQRYIRGCIKQASIKTQSQVQVRSKHKQQQHKTKVNALACLIIIVVCVPCPWCWLGAQNTLPFLALRFTLLTRLCWSLTRGRYGSLTMRHVLRLQGPKPSQAYLNTGIMSRHFMHCASRALHPVVFTIVLSVFLTGGIILMAYILFGC
jgi:hypothetical protein